MTETTLLFADALDLVSEQVEATSDQEWEAASPCEGWRAIDVLSHVTGTVQKAVTAMSGGDYASTPAEAASEVDTTEAIARWKESAARAADAVLTADLDRVVPSPRGELPLRQALELPVADLAVHAWDIAVSTGRDLELSEELRAHVGGMTRAMPEASRGDAFGPAVEAPPGASATDELMAFLGRRRP